MKRFVFTIIISLVVTTSYAQEHLSFMDIPMDCPVETFCNKLVSTKGLVVSTMTDDEQYYGMETKKLVGDFYGIKNCSFYVRRHERLDNVSSIAVKDTLAAMSEGDVRRIIALHDKTFGTHKKDSSQHAVWYSWRTHYGEVGLELYDNGFGAYYTDTTELAVRKAIYEEYIMKRERETVREICGIPFGSSYETTKEVLENKYGTSSILSDRNRIIYNNKSYAGIFFDEILFLFQSDGYKSYLNGCIFILESTSLIQAKEKLALLHRTLSRKYEINEIIDDNGNPCYFGGHSPIPFEGIGFCIDIIKYDNRLTIPYAARLMYGRYNYVKEEF